jgi:tripartite-type tricarboxylate transporter receptor subunit TctC
VKDFAPIAQVHSVPLVVLVKPNSGLTSVQQFIDSAKSKPNTLTAGSAGVGSMNHFAIELFDSTAGVKLIHVPYKGGGPALTGLLGNETNAVFEQMNSSIGFIKDGRLVPLAVTARKRSPALPSVPTLDELGLKGYEAATFVGVLAPAATPKEIVVKLNTAVRQAAEAPAIQQRLRDLGAEPTTGTGEEFGNLVKAELAKWRNLAQQAAMKFE